MKHLKPLLMLVILCVSLVIAPLNAFAAATSSSSSASSDATNSAATDDSVQRIKQKGTLVVGTSADYPPYELLPRKTAKPNMLVLKWTLPSSSLRISALSS